MGSKNIQQKTDIVVDNDHVDDTTIQYNNDTQLSNGHDESMMTKNNININTDSSLLLNETTNSGVCCSSELIKETLQNNTSLVQKTINQLKTSLSFYVTFVSKSSNQDKILKLVQWTLYVAAISASGMANRSRTTFINESLEGSRPKTCTNNNNHQHTKEYLQQLSIGLRKLYNEFSMARYVLRLLGLPSAIEGYSTNSWSYDSTNIYYNTIGKILSGSMIFYYPAEALAYTYWMSPQLLSSYSSTKDISRYGNYWSYISCRFWVLYIITELSQNIYHWYELRRKLTEQQSLLLKRQQQREQVQKAKINGIDSNNKNVHQAATSSIEKIDNDNDTNLQQLQFAYQQNNLQIYRNILFMLPCINWSLPNWDTDPWLSEHTNNILMWFESIISIYQAILAQK